MASQVWTIKKLLEWMVPFFQQKNIDSPRLSAELLLSYVLNVKRIELYTKFNSTVSAEDLAKLRQLVKRTADNEPYAYLIGRTEFYSLSFKITPACLIPRPETELLVERAIDFLRSREKIAQQYICDLCTGSGCVAIAIAKNFSNCHILAADISNDALTVASENVLSHDMTDKISLLVGDLFNPVDGIEHNKFDLIVSNPPYVSSSEFEKLDENVKDYEPRQALYGGEDGLDIYCRIIQDVKNYLTPDGALMMEIGYNQGSAVMEMAKKVFSCVHIEKDLADNDRVVIASDEEIRNYIPKQT